MTNTGKSSPESQSSSSLLNQQKTRHQLLRTAAHNKLLSFCQVVDPFYEAEWFHEVIADILETALKRTIGKEKTRIILTIPPRHGKTQTASIYFPAWALGKYPNLKFILSSYGQELSEKVGMKTRDVIQSDKYQAIFPNTNLRQDSKAKAYWRTKQGGSYFAVGVGSAVTGEGGNIILIDDPFKNREEAESELYREKTWEYYRSTLYSRLEGAGTVIVIMQRWHTDDLVGRLLEADEASRKAGQPTEDWEVINFPAIADGDEYYKGHKTRSSGDPLWPFKFPLEVLHNIREVQGTYNWSCTPGETPILMANWESKEIAEVAPGDQIIGFELGNSNTRRKLVTTTVKNTFSKIGDVYEYTLASGRKVRCTLDHKWFSGRNDKSHRAYKPMKIGNKLMFVAPPYDFASSEEEKNWRYFAGLVDGEGHIGKACLALHQSPGANPEVFQKMKDILWDLGLQYTLYQWSRDNPKWKEAACFNIKNTFDVYRKLIRLGKSGKSSQCARRLTETSGAFVRHEDEIVDIKFIGRHRVYALETETGNYVAWGYASSNSQYMQDPILAENQEFKKEMFRYFEEEELEGKYLKYFTFVDPAISQKKEADNTVVLTIAKEIHGPNFYRIREDAGKYTPQQTLDLIFKHYESYRSEVYLETVAYQKALKFALEEQQKIRQRYFRIYETKTGNKEERIRSLLPLYERGVIFHRKSDVEYEREILAFPRGKHDDRPDCMSFLTHAMGQSSFGKARQFYPHLTSLKKKGDK